MSFSLVGPSVAFFRSPPPGGQVPTWVVGLRPRQLSGPGGWPHTSAFSPGIVRRGAAPGLVLVLFWALLPTPSLGQTFFLELSLSASSEWQDGTSDLRHLVGLPSLPPMTKTRTALLPLPCPPKSRSGNQAPRFKRQLCGSPAM